MKKYGQDLKRDYERTEQKLNNLTDKINKRFQMIINDYQKYITESDKKVIMMNGANSLSIDSKCKIIMNTEENYVKENGTQLNLFEE